MSEMYCRLHGQIEPDELDYVHQLQEKSDFLVIDSETYIEVITKIYCFSLSVMGNAQVSFLHRHLVLPCVRAL